MRAKAGVWAVGMGKEKVHWLALAWANEWGREWATATATASALPKEKALESPKETGKAR